MNTVSQKAAIDYIDAWLGYHQIFDHLPGLVVAVQNNNKVIFTKAYGYANVEHKELLTPEHLFRIASHSKMFTATAVMQLQEQGKLKLDDALVQYLPWLAKHNDKRWQKVTIRQLLSHSAGVVRDGSSSDYWQLMADFPNEQQLKDQIMQEKLILENNTEMKYSNYGYSLLGMAIVAASGQSYTKFVHQNILNPLKLQNTYVDYEEVKVKPLVTGYSRMEFGAERQPLGNPNTNAMAPATGFVSTAEDLVRFVAAHKVGSGKLLNDESKKEMQRVQYLVPTEREEGYGLGFDLSKRNGHFSVIGHGGGFPGQTTKTLFTKDDSFVVSILVNSNEAWAESYALSVLSILDAYKEAKPQKAKLNHFKGRFFNMWSIIDTVVVGDQVYLTYPTSWQPLKNAIKLKYIDAKTLQLPSGEMSGYDSAGETIVYDTDSDKPATQINYAGYTMWDENTYRKRVNG